MVFLRYGRERRRRHLIEGPGNDGPNTECMHRWNPHPHPESESKRGEDGDQGRLSENARKKSDGGISGRCQASIRGKNVEHSGAEELEAKNLVSEPYGNQPRDGRN